MILDNLLMFDLAQNFTNVTAPTTVNSANVIDLHIINGGLPVLSANQGARDIGIGDDPAMKLLVQVTVAFTSAGSPTVTVNLQGAQDNGAGAPGAYTTYYSSPAVTLAQLVLGARLMDMDMPRPPVGVGMPRFLRLTYVTATNTITAGTIESGLVLDRPDQIYNSTINSTWGGYPPGVTVAN